MIEGFCGKCGISFYTDQAEAKVEYDDYGFFTVPATRCPHCGRLEMTLIDDDEAFNETYYAIANAALMALGEEPEY